VTADEESPVESALRDYGPDVLRYLQRRAPEDASDIFGATMVVAWRRRDRMPAHATEARMWLFGVARMTLLGHWRNESRRLRTTEKLREAIRPPANHDEAVALDVRRAIEALPAREAELVTLVHWDGFTLAEAAALTGMNASTARGRYQRARETLAAELSAREAGRART
jgi:RNA polymerase sigma-70 factor (ECF subfamily)